MLKPFLLIFFSLSLAFLVGDAQRRPPPSRPPPPRRPPPPSLRPPPPRRPPPPPPRRPPPPPPRRPPPPSLRPPPPRRPPPPPPRSPPPPPPRRPPPPSLRPPPPRRPPPPPPRSPPPPSLRPPPPPPPRRPPPPPPIQRPPPPPPPEVPSPPPVVDYQWDLFILSQQWPPVFCPSQLQCTGPSHSVLDYFTIEGFWPYNLTTGILSDCTGSTFDIQSVSEFREDLDHLWPSLYRGVSNEELWDSEWNNYGTCSESILDQTAYFRAALALKNQFDLLDILAQSGIVPNGGYSYLDIFQAITNGINLRPLLKCRREPTKPLPPHYVLTSISLCADKDGQSFVDCPPQHDQQITCGQIDLPFVKFYPPLLDKNSVLISSNATTTSAAIGFE